MAADTIVHTYDPKNVIVSWKGVTFTGYAEDTFITIARDGNAFDKTRGADGTIARANKNATNFSVKLTFLQTSPTNDALLDSLNSDIQTNDGTGILSIVEVITGKLAFSATAWIEKDPDGDWGNKINSREWTFSTGAGLLAGMGAI